MTRICTETCFVAGNPGSEREVITGNCGTYADEGGARDEATRIADGLGGTVCEEEPVPPTGVLKLAIWVDGRVVARVYASRLES